MSKGRAIVAMNGGVDSSVERDDAPPQSKRCCSVEDAEDARRSRSVGARHRLLKGTDARKDQSYVLFTLTQTELGRLRLPIGEYRKETVRWIAAEAGLPVAGKPDSQEICFISDGDYRRFVGDRTRAAPGGHSGRLRQRPRHPPGHTVLHRRPAQGPGLNGNRGSPTYVIDIDAESNTVTIGAEEELLRTRLWASRMSFTSGSPPREPIEVPAEIRYKASEAPATVSPDGEWLRIDFHDPSAR